MLPFTAQMRYNKKKVLIGGLAYEKSVICSF